MLVAAGPMRAAEALLQEQSTRPLHRKVRKRRVKRLIPMVGDFSEIRFGVTLEPWRSVGIAEDGYVHGIINIRHAGPRRIEREQGKRDRRLQWRVAAKQTIQDRFAVVGTPDDEVG